MSVSREGWGSSASSPLAPGLGALVAMGESGCQDEMLLMGHHASVFLLTHLLWKINTSSPSFPMVFIPPFIAGFAQGMWFGAQAQKWGHRSASLKGETLRRGPRCWSPPCMLCTAQVITCTAHAKVASWTAFFFFSFFSFTRANLLFSQLQKIDASFQLKVLAWNFVCLKSSLCDWKEGKVLLCCQQPWHREAAAGRARAQCPVLTPLGVVQALTKLNAERFKSSLGTSQEHILLGEELTTCF